MVSKNLAMATKQAGVKDALEQDTCGGKGEGVHPSKLTLGFFPLSLLGGHDSGSVGGASHSGLQREVL